MFVQVLWSKPLQLVTTGHVSTYVRSHHPKRELLAYCRRARERAWVCTAQQKVARAQLQGSLAGQLGGQTLGVAAAAGVQELLKDADEV